MNRIAQRMLGVGAVVAFSLLAVQVAAAATSVVASSRPNALVASTNDLYWTTHHVPQPGPNVAEVWRTSKQSTPGGEQLLYREQRNTSISFNSLVYAQVDGQEYVYFIANYDGWISYIKRVPATGGPAAFVSRVQYMAGRDLKTDGSYLYWADPRGVRRMPLAGGTITHLVRAVTGTEIGLDTQYVYFTLGASGTSLYRVPKAGGAYTIQAIASSTVTDLYVHEAGAQTTLYWSEDNGAVQSYTIGANAPVPYPTESTDATSVAVDGSRVLWTECSFLVCFVVEYQAGVRRDLYGSFFDRNLSAGHLVADTTVVFWGNATSILKYSYPPPSPSLAVSISPPSIEAVRQGRGSITRRAQAVVSNGSGFYLYGWSIDNGVFHLSRPSPNEVSIFAAIAACDSWDGTLSVTVTDVLRGGSASASAYVRYEATRPPGGVCD